MYDSSFIFWEMNLGIQDCRFFRFNPTQVCLRKPVIFYLYSYINRLRYHFNMARISNSQNKRGKS